MLSDGTREGNPDFGPSARQAARADLADVLAVEVLAEPHDEIDLVDRVEDAVRRIRSLDWKLQDVLVASSAFMTSTSTSSPGRSRP